MVNDTLKMNSDIVNLRDVKNSCEYCSIYKHCLNRQLHTKVLDEFKLTVRRHYVLQRGELLFSAGSDFHSLYVVHSGSVKSWVNIVSGDEQVTGFHFPGELLGADGIESGCHTYNAAALETSSICEISYKSFNELISTDNEWQSLFLNIMSHSVNEAHVVHGMLGKMTAEQRMASFILSISARLNDLGNSSLEFNLSMARQDIANYLGLAVETVSRVLTRFQDAGLISIDKRHLLILNREGMLAMTNACVDEASNKKAI